ncbi:MAG: tetratricopeptide repeat protein [Rhodocyclaceae bacterium]|nr:tetratricopeptide repeat protein [Rhodocyclaceae bacterium]
MSLINQMLQDLESRRATLSGDAGATQEIRSLPPQRAAVPWTLILGGIALVLMAGAGAWWFMGGGQATMAPTPLPAPVAAVTPATPIAPPPAAVAPELPQQTAETASAVTPTAAPAVVVPPAAAEPPVAEKVTSLPPRPASKAQNMPVHEASPPPVRKESAAARKAAEARSSELKVATALSQVPPSDAPAADDGARIEKKMRMSTPRERAENEYRRALGLVNQGRIQEGVAVLRSALSEDTGHAGARLALFGLLVEQQRYEEAQTLLEVTLARDPAQPQMASRLARLKLERGDARGAEETLARAAAAATDNAEYRALHAAVLQRLTLHKRAVAEYQAALQLAPQAGVWWMGLGISLEADGRLPEAKDAFQRARATGALSPELAAFVDQKLKRLP